jgi:uncharacterized membrane protein
MTLSAAEIIERYISRLRAELAAAGAPDTDELVAEIRSLLTEASHGDATAAEAEIERLGEPADLARGILAERGLDATTGMSTATWWRLGIAAPIDLAIGLAVPFAVAPYLYAIAATGEPRVAAVTVAFVLGALSLTWPFFIWRPWRIGGRALSPGMTITGVAIVRAPGFWRPVSIDELEGMGLAPRRRTAWAVVVVIGTVVLIVGASILGLVAWR